MDVYLGLGSNLGDRRRNLAAAAARLGRDGVDVVDARRPPSSLRHCCPTARRRDWNRPFLNAVARCAHRAFPGDRRSTASSASRPSWAGPLDGPRWAPAPDRHRHPALGTGADPHASGSRCRIRRLTQRSFVLTPLAALAPRLTIPGRGPTTVLGFARALAPPDSALDGHRQPDPRFVLRRRRAARRPERSRPASTRCSRRACSSSISARNRRGRAPCRSTPRPSGRGSRRSARAAARQGRAAPLRPLVSVDTYHASCRAARASRRAPTSSTTSRGLTHARHARARRRERQAMGRDAQPDRAGPPPRDAAGGRRSRRPRSRMGGRAQSKSGRPPASRSTAWSSIPASASARTPLQSLALLRNVAAVSPPELRVLDRAFAQIVHRSFSGTERRAEQDSSRSARP